MIPSTGDENRPLAVGDTPIVTLLNSGVCFLAAACAAVCGVSWLLTFTPWTQFMGTSYFVPFFVAMFPLFGWAVFVLDSRRRAQPDRRSPADWRKELPPAARIPITVIFVGVAVTFLLTMPSLPGQPEYQPTTHRYVYDEHGVLIPATRSAWLHAVAAQNRLFLGVVLLFTSVAAAVTWAERNRRRGRVVPTRWLQPVRPRPRRLPPAPLLALAAAAGLAGLIACAVLIVGRIDAYNADGIYLHAGPPVRVVLPPDGYVVFVGCTEEMACPQLTPAAFAAQTAGGTALAVIRDPSSDHLSENGVPFVGELSFTVPEREAVNLELGTRLGQPAFVVPSPGEEASALAGWIAVAVVSLTVLAVAELGLGVLLIWRLGFGVPRAPYVHPSDALAG